VGLAVDAAAENANVYLGTTLIAAAEPISIKNIVRGSSVGADRIVFGSNSPSGVASMVFGMSGSQRRRNH